MGLDRITPRPLLAYYFGATPLFFVLDVALPVPLPTVTRAGDR